MNSRRQAPVVGRVGGCLFCYGYKFLFLALAAGAAPRFGKVFKLGAGRYSLLGVTLLWVVSVLTGAFHLCHSRNCFSYSWIILFHTNYHELNTNFSLI